MSRDGKAARMARADALCTSITRFRISWLAVPAWLVLIASMGSITPALGQPYEAGLNMTDDAVRFATFNISLNRYAEGGLAADLAPGDDPQAHIIAEIIQRVDPDVILLNEFDYDASGQAVESFRDLYLESTYHGIDPVVYPYVFLAPSNTGIPSGHDLNNDGSTTGADDAYGFGYFPGHYGMVVLSKYPILTGLARTFQYFLWKDMPHALLPDDPNTPEAEDWYTPTELDIVRLSSKSHWDVPIQINNQVVHFLVSHPTPPVFDGAEDRNGKRNHDEVRFWSDYICPAASGYIYDDAGWYGGLPNDSRFVIAGDLNADPYDGDSYPGTPEQLLDNARINTTLTPSSLGGPDASTRQGGSNLSHTGDPAYDTADFADGGTSSGNLRADYVLPSANLTMLDARVYWLEDEDPLFWSLIGEYPFPGSDHRLTWVDLVVPDPELTPRIAQAVARRSHGDTSYDRDLLTPTAGQTMVVEGRIGGPEQFVITFDEPIQALTASPVMASIGAPGDISIAGNTLTVEYTGAVSGEILTLSFPGIADMTGGICTETLCLAILEGDTNDSGSVNIFDLLDVRNNLGQTITAERFRVDVQPDGATNIFDLLGVRNRLGRTSPGTCP